MLTCDECRDAVSARMDGEGAGAPTTQVEAHLRACAACRDYAAGLHRLDAVLPDDRLVAPDRSAEILAAVRDARTRRGARGAAGAGQVARVGLALVALVQMVAAVAGLATGAGVHSLRDLGAFQLALAIGFLVAAARPRTAAGLLPTAAALAACLLAVAVADVAGAYATASGEAAHVTELLGVLLVWLVARTQPSPSLRQA